LNSGKGKTVVHFWEDDRILAIIDRVAKNRGSDRSAVYREAARFYLAMNSHLTEQEQIDVGARPINPTKRVEANRS